MHSLLPVPRSQYTYPGAPQTLYDGSAMITFTSQYSAMPSRRRPRDLCMPCSASHAVRSPPIPLYVPYFARRGLSSIVA